MTRFLLVVGFLVSVVGSALAETYHLRVSGKADYQFQTDSDYRALKKVTIQVWESHFGGDQILALGYTDDSGNYGLDVESSDSGGPDIYVKAILDDGGAVEVEEDGTAEYLTSDTHADQQSDITINMRFDAASGKNDEARVYQVIYDALKSTDFGSKTMDKVHATRAGVADNETSFETAGQTEIRIGANHVWYTDNDLNYGTFSICHELGHAIMWSMRGHNWPVLGAAPYPHHMNQEAGRGFAWREGWAHTYASARCGVEEGPNNLNLDDPNSTEREGSPYWAGARHADGTIEDPATGTNNSGLSVEGAVASAGYLIGYGTVWPIVRDNGNTINTFRDVWSHLSKTQVNRKTIERNNMILARGRLFQIRVGNSGWSDFTDGFTVHANQALSFRARENGSAVLNLEMAEKETVTGMRFSYQRVIHLASNVEWFPEYIGWTEIGTATSRTGDDWQIVGWTPTSAGDYWVRAQAVCGTGATTSQDTILPGDTSDTIVAGMRAWSRGSLHAILYLKVEAAVAGDPSFIQPDERQLDALVRERSARAQRLQALTRESKFRHILGVLEERAK